jgi:hypothetical protein
VRRLPLCDNASRPFRYQPLLRGPSLAPERLQPLIDREDESMMMMMMMMMMMCAR